jgi:predicted membrane protein
MIPLDCHMCIRRTNGRLHRIWIPLLLVYPLVIAVLALVELLVLIACIVLLFVWPREAVKIALAIPACLYLLLQASGLRMEFAGPGQPDVLVEVS